MSALSREPASGASLPAGRVWTAAVASLFLLAACKGGVPKSDTGGAPPDTTAAAAAPAPTPQPTDTTTKTDSSKKGSTAKSDSAGTPSAVKPAGPKPTTANKTAPTTSAADTGAQKSASDTGAKQSSDSGAQQSASADAPLRDAYHQPPRDTVSQEVYQGWKQFNLNCARCHGEDVTGTTLAPHLIMSLKPDGPINSKELFISTVCSGRPAKGMPAWCSLGLEMDKIQEIYSYVKGRSDGKLAPGRPAVKAGEG